MIVLHDARETKQFFFFNFSLFILPVLYRPLVHVYMSEHNNQKQCHAEEYSNEYPQLSGTFKLWIWWAGQ